MDVRPPALEVSSIGPVPDRDVAEFDRRAHGYEEGWRGKLHHQIADRTADLALACVAAPRRILDVGCGTGYLLRQLAERAPQAIGLSGIDAAPSMIEVARGYTHDDRIELSPGFVEQLPYPAPSGTQPDSSTRPGSGRLGGRTSTPH